ncbi:MAG: thioesterase family protein [Desulfosalsimonadaceae bacterium]
MHSFDSDIAVSQKARDRFFASISGNWSINNTPNGGYLLAVLANAMISRSDKKATPLLTANYLSRTTAGEAEIAAEEISRSRQFSRLQARLMQAGEEKIRAFGTFAIEPDQCFIRRYEQRPPEISPAEDCVRIPAMPRYSLYESMDVRLDPECAGWMEGRLSEKSEHKGWLRFPGNRRLDVFAVILAADAFPPAVLASQGMTAWVPTLEFSISIRGQTEAQWLKCRFRTRFINCGLLEEDGEIWDDTGELLAVSRQIAQYRQVLE